MGGPLQDAAHRAVRDALIIGFGELSHQVANAEVCALVYHYRLSGWAHEAMRPMLLKLICQADPDHWPTYLGEDLESVNDAKRHAGDMLVSKDVERLINQVLSSVRGSSICR